MLSASITTNQPGLQSSRGLGQLTSATVWQKVKYRKVHKTHFRVFCPGRLLQMWAEYSQCLHYGKVRQCYFSNLTSCRLSSKEPLSHSHTYWYSPSFYKLHFLISPHFMAFLFFLFSFVTTQEMKSKCFSSIHSFLSTV